MKLIPIVNLWPPFEEGFVTTAIESTGAPTGEVSVFSQVTCSLSAFAQASGEASVFTYSGSLAEVTA